MHEIDKISGVYVVKPIKKSYLSLLDKKHDGETIFTKGVYNFTPFRSSSTGLIMTGLNKEETKELEESLGYEAGALNPYNYQDATLKKQQGKFCWANYFIPISKEGLILDTNASDKAKLNYKLLTAMAGKDDSIVVTSQAEAAMNPFAELIVFSKEGEAKIEKGNQDLKKRAYKKYSTLSHNEMLEFLTVYKEGKHRVSKDSTIDIIDSEVGKIVERESQEFLDLLSNPMYKNMVFLSNCVAAKAVFKQGPKYILQGGDILGNNFLEAVTNLSSDDFNGVKISLTAKLEAIK